MFKNVGGYNMFPITVHYTSNLWNIDDLSSYLDIVIWYIMDYLVLVERSILENLLSDNVHRSHYHFPRVNYLSLWYVI